MLRIVAFGIVASLVATLVWADEPFPRADRLGLSLGTPAGLNLEYSHEFGRRAAASPCDRRRGSRETAR